MASTAHADPAVPEVARARLEGRAPDPEALAESPLVHALSRDHGLHPYAKWRGAFWRLVSLVELPHAHLTTIARTVGLDVEGGWWKRPGSKGSNVEAVDWGAAADELLTIACLAVLS